MRRSGGRKRKTAISNVYKSEQHLSIMNISRDFSPLPFFSGRRASGRYISENEKIGKGKRGTVDWGSIRRKRNGVMMTDIHQAKNAQKSSPSTSLFSKNIVYIEEEGVGGLRGLNARMDGWMAGAPSTGNVALHAPYRTVPFAASTRTPSLPSRVYWRSMIELGVCRLANSAMDPSLYHLSIFLAQPQQQQRRRR